MGPCGGTVCFETSGNKWDRKYKDWYCGNSPQCRDILLSTHSKLFTFLMATVLTKSARHLTPHTSPHTFILSHKLPSLCQWVSWAGLASHRSYHRRSLSFIAKTLIYFFGPEIPQQSRNTWPWIFCLKWKIMLW